MRNIKDFQARYDRWKNGERYWDIRGINLPQYDSANKNTITTNDGSIFNVDPSAIGARNLEVTTPDVEVIGKKQYPYQSAFNPYALTEGIQYALGNTVGKVMEPISKIPGAMPVLRTLTPSNLIGTLRTGIPMWDEKNPGFGDSYGDKQLNLLFDLGTSVSPIRVNYGTPLQKLKYSRLGERVRGIKVTDEVHHGSYYPFDIDKARTSNPKTGDSGFHVGDTSEPTLFKANSQFGGVQYKGKLQLKEPAFEVPDFERWNPYQFWSYAKENKEFANYLQRHGLSVDDFGRMSDKIDDGVQQLADRLKDSGIALKYKNKYETRTGNGYSYYLTNPKQAHFTEILDFGKPNSKIWDTYTYVKKAPMSALVQTNNWQSLPTSKYTTIRPIGIINKTSYEKEK